MVFVARASVDQRRGQRFGSPVNRREVSEYMEDSPERRIVLFSRVARIIGAITANKRAAHSAIAYR